MIAVESSISWRNNVKNCNLTSIVSDISRYAGIHAGCVTHQHPARAWIPPRTLLRCRAGPGSEPGAGCPTRSAPPSACNRKHWSQKFPPDWHLCYNDEYWKLYSQPPHLRRCCSLQCDDTGLQQRRHPARESRWAGAPRSPLGSRLCLSPMTNTRPLLSLSCPATHSSPPCQIGAGPGKISKSFITACSG